MYNAIFNALYIQCKLIFICKYKNKMASSQEEILDFLKAYRSRNNLTIIKFLQQKKIIHPVRECKCGLNLKLVPRPDVPDQFAWRCSKCSARVSLRRGTFLESFKISLQTIFSVLYSIYLNMLRARCRNRRKSICKSQTL